MENLTLAVGNVCRMSIYTLLREIYERIEPTPTPIRCENVLVKETTGFMDDRPFEYHRVDKDRSNTALHLAAKFGHPAIWEDFIKDREEISNSLHDAPTAGQIDFMKEIGSINYLEMLLRDSNTALHVAAASRQRDILELLLDGNSNSKTRLVDVNAVNAVGLTPLDILNLRAELEPDPVDLEIKKMLQRAGGLTGDDMRFDRVLLNPDLYKKALKMKYMFVGGTDSSVPPPSQESRIELLLISMLIAGLTFGAGLNPPRVLFKDENKFNQQMPFRLFMIFNSAGFLASLAVVLLSSFQQALGQGLLLFSVFSMVASYVCSVTILAKSAGFDVVCLGIPVFVFIALQYVLLLVRKSAGKKETETVWNRKKLSFFWN